MRGESVAVVIPTYNRKHLTERAVQSVLNQTVTPNEIYVVDDGSTDGTSEYISSNYKQVRVRAQPHQGVSSARNTGIDASTSDWICFLDSDDTWHPAKLEKQLKTVDITKNKLVSHTQEAWCRHGTYVKVPSKYRKKGGDIFNECVRHCAIGPSTTMIHRGVFDACGLFDPGYEACEDYELWLRISSKYKVSVVDTALTTKYAGHADQLSTSVWGLDRFRIRALHKILTSSMLNPSQHEVATQEIIRKSEIFIAGCQKHGRDSREFIELLTHYKQMTV